MEMKKYLIDSDILIDYLRGSSNTRDFLFGLNQKATLMISAVNVVEIYSGKNIQNTNKKKIIDCFLNEFKIIPLEKNLAKEAGEIRMKYQTPFADAIIAASAIKSQAILATRNIKHFSKIKNLKIISPE